MTETPESNVSERTTSVISDHERELAQNALTDFQKSSYNGCLSNLNKLEALRPKDLKVMHNKFVTEYYKSDFKKTEVFRKSLNAVCGQMNTADNSEGVDDVERCVMRYNQAVLFYHTKQYHLALKIVNKLFTFVEPMEESLVHKVCVLLIELHIVTNQPDAALSLLNYIESQFVSTDTSKITPGDKENAIKPIKEITTKEKKDNIDAATDAFRIKLLKYKARVYLMTHQSKFAKREWKALVSSGIPVNISSVFLKGNLEYLRGNYRKAIKILNSISADGLEYKNSGEAAAVLYYNNIACLHHAMGKPNLACFYLQKALQENKTAVESVQVKDSDPLSSQPLYTLGGNKHYELTYSLGVSLLHAGRPAQAFECFTEAAQKLHNSPRLWLRMAECCIYSHKPTNEIDFDMNKRRKDLVQKVVGSGFYRKIILASALSKDTKYHTEGLSYAIPQPTLEFGMLCLKNALFLLPNDNEVNLPSTPLAGPQSVPISLNPSHVIGGQHATQISQATALEALNLRASVLASSSYVSLCLGDNVIALEHAKELLSMSKLSGAYKMLGNLYAAESLILMNKISEAIEYLKPENIVDVDTFLPIPTDTLDKEKDKPEETFATSVRNWYPNSLPTGKAVIQYNLAVAYAIRGELDKSGETLKQVWISKGPDCDVPIHVIMLALYIELQLGKKFSFYLLSIKRILKTNGTSIVTHCWMPKC